MTIFSTWLSVLFPEKCRGCSKPGIALCSTCIRRIPCAVDLPTHTFAVFDYGHPLVRATIRQLKYHRRSESAHALATAAAPAIAEYLSTHLQSIGNESYILVPIPEYTHKERVRGFNQSYLLATWWHDLLPGSIVVPFLEKTSSTIPQAHLRRTARMKNVTNTMQATQSLDPKAIYVVVDDVTTTGATFDEARRALKASGARKIISIALAHGYSKK